MNHKLSSPLTWLNKIVLPAAFLLAWPVLLSLGLARGGYQWIPVLAWTIGCAALLVWTWPIKTVEWTGDAFVISNYITTHRVPASHLRRFTENRMNRTPTITLYFEPPTPFGRRVRIIPIPPFSFSMARFDEVAKLLNSVLEQSNVSAAT